LHEDIEGWLVAYDATYKLMVALDTEIDDALRAEGLARELVSRIQSLRKDKGLEITDRIKLFLDPSELLKISIEQNLEYIKAETLATDIEFTLDGMQSVAKTEDINGEICRMALEKK